MSRLICLILILLSVSCSELQMKLSPEVFYRNDLQINQIFGSGTVPNAKEYPFNITSYSDMDLLTVTTCHREYSAQPKAKTASYVYRPQLEEHYFCPVYFSAYNREGRTSFGLVIPENPKHTQEAILECNGKIKSHKGIAICESRAGLKQKISFPEKMLPAKPVNGPAERKEDCPVIAPNATQVWEFSLPNRECLYQWKNSSTGATFQLYTIGYEQIIVR